MGGQGFLSLVHYLGHLERKLIGDRAIIRVVISLGGGGGGGGGQGSGGTLQTFGWERVAGFNFRPKYDIFPSYFSLKGFDKGPCKI